MKVVANKSGSTCKTSESVILGNSEINKAMFDKFNVYFDLVNGSYNVGEQDSDYGWQPLTAEMTDYLEKFKG